nr:TPA_asm: m52.4 sORF 1 [Murid betaherpesvirus 1]DBA08000.1 TPA_asm: m52.4 sORF 1 [Murid betaherpesvirus 1]
MVSCVRSMIFRLLRE